MERTTTEGISITLIAISSYCFSTNDLYYQPCMDGYKVAYYNVWHSYEIILLFIIGY